MKNVFSYTLLLYFISCAPVLIAPRPVGGPPPHAKAHGLRAKQAVTYMYYYYPDVEVYFYPVDNTYVVFQNGAWVTLAARPAVLLPAYTYVTLQLAEPRPWLKHKVYKKKYPPGQLKNKKGKKW